ncbi:MAG: type II 3-dehydroquinate dehydratase [Elusimicrobiota bacterium]|nr:type II 3-dehydroquinate dehydratase [Elusimicrobiota bacterium]
MKTVVVINGPNMDRLGVREPGVYGSISLEELNNKIAKKAETLGLKAEFFQSNHEGDIVDRIGSAGEDAIVINPAAYTHTSIALRDALAAYEGEIIEVHISNIFAREDFRSKSLTASSCRGVISGLGAQSYLLALEGLKNLG